MQNDIARDTYVAQYRVTDAEMGGGFVATAYGRSFHEGLFGTGETPEAAKKMLVEVLADALRGPLGVEKGFEKGRFTRILLMSSEVFDIEGTSTTA
jgi:diacylglycerol kinase family enzyme